MVLLRECVIYGLLENWFENTDLILQIRIVTDTHVPEDAPKKKKLKGYAFIVYERERDMKCNDPRP